MNKKGFSLVELMAVMIILGILATITTPIVINIVSDTEKELSSEQTKIVIDAARNWGIKNITVTKSDDNYVVSKNFVTIKELQDSGDLEKRSLRNLNLNDSQLNSAGVCISYDNQYIYRFVYNVEEC